MKFSFHYQAHAEALYYALTEDAFYITMEASVDNKRSPREAMIKYMDYSMQEAAAYGELILPTGHTYGASLWSRPIDEKKEAERDRLKEAFLFRQMGEKSLETYRNIVDSMSLLSGQVVDKSFWYLSILGLHPSCQGKGRGGSLLVDVLQKADRHGADTYLETFTPRNISFYERFSFQTVADFHEPNTNARYWVMVRKKNTHHFRD
ncbi:MAG: hypothetical protein CSA26_06735 [Desulfobacterales bacterium]|nr:MAG: hypothetical protein CSA26_06735 [Desulfobacterales bacterium]